MTKKTLWLLLGLIISWRVGLVILSVVADWLLPYQPSFPYAETLLANYGFPRWFYSWANFDGVHYLTIAEKGYVGTGLIQAFFPVFPMTMMVLTTVTHNSLLSGLVLAQSMTVICIGLWFAFLKRFYSPSIAWIGTVILLAFPTSFFLGALYTESLFLALVVGSFYAARLKKWWLAGILAAVAAATRVVGVLLVPALLVELLIQRLEQSRQPMSLALIAKILTTEWQKIAWIMLGSVGLVAYMVYLGAEFNDPLYFLHVQAEFGAGRQESIVLFPQVVWRYIKILLTYRPYDWKYLAFVQEFVMSGLGGIGLVLAFKYVRASYVVFALGAFLVPTLTGTFSSMPRYIIVCFPLFIMMAHFFDSRRWLFWFYLIVSMMLLVLNTVLFIQGYWVA